MKKAISILLSFILTITSTFCFGVTASADDEVFTYDKATKTLTVDVKGTVYDNEINKLAYKDEIERVNVQKSVTQLGLNAFASLSSLKKLVVLNPDCVFNNNGVLPPNRNDITIYSGDNSSTSAAKIHASEHGYNFKLVYYISFTNNMGTTAIVNALEDYTAEDLAKEAPSFSFETAHNEKTGKETACVWKPEIKAPKDFQGPYKEDYRISNFTKEQKITSPTCTKDGKIELVCNLCGHIFSTTTIEATGHDFGDNNELEYCKNCNEPNPNYTPPTTTTQPATTTTTQPTTTAQTTTAVSTTQVPASETTTPATTVSTTSTPSSQSVTSAVTATATATSTEYQAPITAAQTTKTADTTKKANKTVKKPKNTKIKKLTSKKANLTITWSKISGVKGYQIQVATDKKFKKNKKTVTIKKQKTTKKTIKKLKSGKKYYVRIRTYKISQKKKIYSSWTKAKTVKIK